MKIQVKNRRTRGAFHDAYPGHCKGGIQSPPRPSPSPLKI